MRILALLMLVLASQAFANEMVKRKITVDFMGDHFGNRIYYRCDVAEEILQSHLEKVGAVAIETSCSGGLERWGYSPYWAPMSVRAKFEVTDERRLPGQQVILNADDRAHEDCFLNVAIMKELIPLIPNARVIKKKDHCMNNETRWSVTLEI